MKRITTVAAGLCLAVYGASTTLVLVGCGPSAAERQRIEAENQARVEQARGQADQERQRAAARQVERSERAIASFREYIRRTIADPSVKPRRYFKELNDVQTRGTTLVLTLGFSDKDEAVKLCNVALVGWFERKELGINAVHVVNEDGALLAESKLLNTGAEVCK